MGPHQLHHLDSKSGNKEKKIRKVFHILYRPVVFANTNKSNLSQPSVRRVSAKGWWLSPNMYADQHIDQYQSTYQPRVDQHIGCVLASILVDCQLTCWPIYCPTDVFSTQDPIKLDCD